MNTLSWLIYAANVIPNLGILFALLGVASLLLIIMYCIAYESFPKTSFYFVPITLFACASIIPTQQTILLIAASQMGEKAIETDVGQQAIRILKDKLSEIELEQTRKKTQ